MLTANRSPASPELQRGELPTASSFFCHPELVSGSRSRNKFGMTLFLAVSRKRLAPIKSGLASQSGFSNLIIVGAIALLLVGAIILAPIVSRPPSNTNNANSSPTPQGFGVDDQSISLLYLGTGDIELENIKKSPDFLGCTTDDTNATRCELRSPLVARPNLVIVKDGKLLFKRTITNPLANGRLPSYGNLSSGLGAANQVQKGSRFYGPYFQTYIYATKGVTIISNPNTGEVQEVQVYPSQSISDYLSTFGEDIRGYTPTISAL